jgi:hypothetical protein
MSSWRCAELIAGTTLQEGGSKRKLEKITQWNGHVARMGEM